MSNLSAIPLPVFTGCPCPMSRLTEPPKSLASRLLIVLLAMAMAMSTVSWAEDDGRGGTASGPVAEIAADGTAMESARQAVERAEEVYHRAAAARDRRAFHGQLSPDVIFLGEELHRGRIDMLVAWTPLFDGKYSFRYRAHTLGIEVARSQDIAWTYGEVETSFVHPATPGEPTVTSSYYLNIWQKDADGAWKVAVASSLVVHPEVGSAREARSGLMSAWPELSQAFDGVVSIEWRPETTVRAASGELAFVLGAYDASFDRTDASYAGGGAFLAVWHVDAQNRWQLAAEGFTPPQIFGGD